MKFANLSSGLRVVQQVWDWLQLTKAEAIKERQTDLWTDGVVYNYLNNLNIIGKDVDASLTDFYSIKVQTGVAYKSGERIYIASSTDTYNSSNPSHTTDNGLGVLVSTRSTGSFNIALTPSNINYIWIAYLQTIDDSVFSLHKETGAKLFYKQTDGYEITINTTGINPDSARYILLGQVDLTGSNTAIASNISIVNRTYAKTLLNRVAIQTNNVGLTDRPATYAVGSNSYFLDDHIRAVGTGTVSPINPHGTTLADLGIEPGQTVEVHRQLEHTNGLIAGSSGTTYPTTSAMYAQRVVVSPGDDYILVKGLTGSEYAIVDGVAFYPTDFPTDVIVSFTGQPTGTYNIYFDSTTLLIGITTSSISSDSTKLWLSTVAWDSGAGDLSVPLDRRRFGTMNALQRWKTDGRPNPAIPGTHGYNLDTNTAEYYNGTTWVSY